MIRLVAIRVVDRIKEAGNTQRVLTAHSDLILSRLGFHELNEQVCSREGYIILHLKDDLNAYEALRSDLNGIYGIEIRESVLCSRVGKSEEVVSGTGVTLVALRIRDRHQNVNDLQKILSLFGCTIRTRLGINIGGKNNEGLIILELTGSSDEMNSLITRLNSLNDTCTALITFS